MCVLKFAWDADIFRKSQEKATASQCYHIVHCDDFWSQCMFVADLTCAVHDIRVWGSSCDCHEKERANRQIVDCDRAGRRLPGAFARVQLFFKHCKDRIAAPMKGDYCFGHDLKSHILEERVWSWRYLMSLVTEMTDWLDKAPCTLARITSTTHLKECRDSYLASSPAKRHRSGHVLFSKDGYLSKLVDESIESGVIHSHVDEHLDSFRNLVIAENRGEGPHAGLSRESRRAPASKRSWHACTQRLDTNIRGSLYSYWEPSTNNNHLLLQTVVKQTQPTQETCLACPITVTKLWGTFKTEHTLTNKPEWLCPIIGMELVEIGVS
jgi:hypothetical protein